MLDILTLIKDLITSNRNLMLMFLVVFVTLFVAFKDAKSITSVLRKVILLYIIVIALLK